MAESNSCLTARVNAAVGLGWAIAWRLTKISRLRAIPSIPRRPRLPASAPSAAGRPLTRRSPPRLVETLATRFRPPSPWPPHDSGARFHWPGSDRLDQPRLGDRSTPAVRETGRRSYSSTPFRRPGAGHPPRGSDAPLEPPRHILVSIAIQWGRPPPNGPSSRRRYWRARSFASPLDHIPFPDWAVFLPIAEVRELPPADHLFSCRGVQYISFSSPFTHFFDRDIPSSSA